MRRPPRERASLLVEPLVAATIGAVVLAGVTVALAHAARWVVRADARAEVHDTADLVGQAFVFDLRSARWDPTGNAGSGLAGAEATALELRVDHDGDGVIDDASTERVRWRWTADTTTLSRLVGDQSMPLASGAVAAQLEYRDVAGTRLVPPVGGLAPSDLARVRTVTLFFTLRAPSGGAPVRRTVTVALRGEDA